MSFSKEFGGLDFRDFKSFNLAMLSKQCWRILNHPNSLPTRIFKEKYFSQGDFMNTSLGPRPSYM